MHYLRLIFIFVTTLAALVLASDSVAVDVATKSSSDWWENTGTILAVGISALTLLAMLGSFVKKVISSNDMEPRLSKTESDISDLRTTIDKNYLDIKDLMHALRIDLANKVNVTNYNDLVQEHQALEETVNAEIEKLNETVNQLTVVETKLNEVKNHFDDSNKERRQEIKEINDTIKGLRENIREDINDVKAVIMKLMMNLKVKDSD